MQIKFYTFSKKPNSTKQPGTAAYETQWTAKGVVDVLNPVILVRMDGNSPIAYNYAYIPAFNRYYFIRGWELVNDLWRATMTCDVLASWKTGIGASRLYITRAADTSITNGNISDAVYPTTAAVQTAKVNITRPWAGATGSYVIGVTCSPPMGIDFGMQIGSTSYFVADAATMKKLAKTLLSEDWTTAAVSGGIDVSTFKAIYNPLQYISSIMYYPYTVANNGFGGSFFCGWYKVMDDPEHKFLGLNDFAYAFNTTVTLPKHPDASSRGAYLNAAPYTEYSIYAPPFGTITLDATRCKGLNSIYIVTTVDQVTGIADLNIYSNSDQAVLLASVHGQVGIPVTLNQISLDHAAEALNSRTMFYDTVSGALGVAGGIIGAATSGGSATGIAGGIGGAVGAAISTAKALDTGIYNGLKLSAARYDSAGETGSFLYLTKVWRLDATFHIQVPEDIAHHGRPVYAMHTLNTISGYIEVQDGDTELACTESESAYIKAALESGIFYE